MSRFDYKTAGVDIDAGKYAIELMKEHVKSTETPGVISDIGGFGGLFQPDLEGYKNPVFVSGADGVGTKLKIAFMLDRHDTVGIDCVAMCVNDVVCTGAVPLFFLDYIATGKLEPKKIAMLVKGISDGCKTAGCAIIGGETAEMPGFYANGEYDIAGFAVGVVDRDDIIDGSKINEGDVVLGIPSSGLHSNGFSLVRRILFEQHKLKVDTYIESLGKSLGEELLHPTKIYVPHVKRVQRVAKLKGIAHITGGGIIENVPRIIPQGLIAEINVKSWQIPPVFTLIKKLGQIENMEMFRTFNMGIGMVMVAAPKDAEFIVKELTGEGACVIGRITRGTGGIKLC